MPTDDPRTPEPRDPTAVYVGRPNLEDPPNVVKEVDPSGLPVLTCGVRLENTGTAPALGLVLYDPIPEGTSYVPRSTEISRSWSGGWEDVSDAWPDSDGGFNGTHVIVVLGDLPAGESVKVHFSVRVSGDLPPGFVVRNQGTVTGLNVPDDPTDFPSSPEEDDPTPFSASDTRRWGELESDHGLGTDLAQLALALLAAMVVPLMGGMTSGPVGTRDG